MNDKLQIFESPQFGQIRVILNEDKPLFVAKDVAIALGYTNPAEAIAMHCKSGDIEKCYVPHENGIGGTNLQVISEGNVYRLVMRSKLPNAIDYQDWVCDDVLPTIRKTGEYSVQKRIPNSFSAALKLAYEQQLKLEQQELLLAEAKPKVEYYDKILSSKDSLTVTQIAKDYGLSAQRLNIILNEEKVQYKQSGQWLPYKEYAQEGYTKSETINFTHKDGTEGTKLNTKWTQKGRLFIHELLKKKNIKPVMDR
nr:MAG TPA: repressor domain protein [Caudoviricetes sp.]